MNDESYVSSLAVVNPFIARVHKFEAASTFAQTPDVSLGKAADAINQLVTAVISA